MPSSRGLNPCLLCLLHWQSGSLPRMPPGKHMCKEAQFTEMVCLHGCLSLDRMEDLRGQKLCPVLVCLCTAAAPPLWWAALDLLWYGFTKLTDKLIRCKEALDDAKLPQKDGDWWELLERHEVEDPKKGKGRHFFFSRMKLLRWVYRNDAPRFAKIQGNGACSQEDCTRSDFRNVPSYKMKAETGWEYDPLEEKRPSTSSLPRQETWPIQPQMKEAAAFAAVPQRWGQGKFPFWGWTAGRVIHLIRNLASRQRATGGERVFRLWFSKEAALSLLGQSGV